MTKQAEYNKNWRKNNPDKWKALCQKHNAAKVARAKKALHEIKNVPCADCGVKYPPYVMDLDHRPGESKIDNPGRLVRVGIKALIAEASKCDVVCANCHRERTHQRLNAVVAELD